MKPAFALSLSFEGISLLHRAPDGWRVVGDVPLSDADLPAALSDLRGKAERLEPGRLRCKVIVPNDQIRYLTIDTGPLQGDARKGRIEAELASATPYALSELRYDMSLQGNVTHVAAVARDTLSEAEAFAVEHGFNPVSFVAIAEPEDFLGEPFFGQAQHAASLDDVDKVRPDAHTVEVVGPARLPQTRPAETPVQPAPVAEPVAEPTPEPPVPEPGFSSRRNRANGGAPSLSGATRNPQPHEAGPAPAVDPAPPEPRVSVAAPGLDLPDDPTPPAEEPAGGFLSRRRPAANPEETVARPVAPDTGDDAHTPRPQPFRAATQPDGPSSGQSSGEPENETDRMTVFGARDSQKIGGKPRFLGLILTAGLLLFLAAVAAWAAIFLDDGVTGLFRGPPPDKELAAKPEADTPVLASLPPANTPEPVEPTAPSTTLAPAPATPPLAVTPAPQPPGPVANTAPAVEQGPSDDTPQQGAAPTLPSLSETDTAVLDALRAIGEPPAALPDDTAPAPATDEARYAATGIWPTAPDVPEAPYIIDLKDVYLASIDRTDLAQDAVALPPYPSLATDESLNSVTSPAAAGTAAAVDPRGLVDPTPEGAVTPDGVMVYLGRPAVVPPQPPARAEDEPDIQAELQSYLAALRPRLRPDGLEELNQRANLGGKSREELAAFRPKLRPKTAKQIAEEDETPTAQAVVVSRKPKTRPRDFAKLVAKAKPKAEAPPAQTTPTAAAVSAASTANIDNGGLTGSGRTGGTSVKGGSVKPAAPSPASVARQATLKNSINLQRLNLIGVYGTPANRRALIRLPSGRYKKVKVGDLVDGGRVVAIGDSELRYQKGGRNMTLKIPSG